MKAQTKITKRIVKAMTSTGPDYQDTLPPDEINPLIIFALATNGTI